MHEGPTAPLFNLKAIASGRSFRLADYHRRYVVLIFVQPTNARQSREVVISIRRKFPDYHRLPIAILIDLHSVPGLLRGTVERIMESAYREAAADVPPTFDPADHLILLPDWKGEVTRSYNIDHSQHDIQLIVIDPDGKIHARLHGPASIGQLLTLLKLIVPAD